MRAFLWKTHRWIGLACFAPFLVLVITGLILLVLPNWPHGTASDIIPTGVDLALQKLPETLPGAKAGMIMPSTSPDIAWTMVVSLADGSRSVVEFAPTTGAILGIYPADSGLRDFTLLVHNSLLMGLSGKVVMILTSIGLIWLMISGFVIMRRRLATLRQGPWTGKQPLKVLHHWAGLVGMMFFLMLTVTGLMLLVYKSLGDLRPRGSPADRGAIAQHMRPPAPAAPQPRRLPVAKIVSAALAKHPEREIQAIMPGRGDGPVSVILLDRGAPPWRKSDSFQFDAHSGAQMPARPKPGFMPVMMAAKSLHTGLWGRVGMRLFYFAGGALYLLLGVSGLLLWWQRRQQRIRPRHRTQPNFSGNNI